MQEKRGIFYAVGVGPGEPELITRKACRILEEASVIAAPRTKQGRMLALEIAQEAVRLENKTILPLEFTMSHDAAVREASYRAAAQAVEEKLQAGQDVAMVNLGDVSLYATAYYLLDIIRQDGFAVQMIPGVTSLSAVAARLGASLTKMEAPLHILPGSMPLDEALGLPGTKVIMKSGSAVQEAITAIDRAGLLDRAAMVADCGLPGEQVFYDLRRVPADVSYFATILVG